MDHLCSPLVLQNLWAIPNHPWDNHQHPWVLQVGLQWDQELHHNSNTRDNTGMVHKGRQWVHLSNLRAWDPLLDICLLLATSVGHKILQLVLKCLLWDNRAYHLWDIRWGPHQDL